MSNFRLSTSCHLLECTYVCDRLVNQFVHFEIPAAFCNRDATWHLVAPHIHDVFLWWGFLFFGCLSLVGSFERVLLTVLRLCLCDIHKAIRVIVLVQYSSFFSGYSLLPAL